MKIHESSGVRMAEFGAWAIVAFVAGTLLCCGSLRADTVYLKNGSAIDCIVLGTKDGMVLLRIGNVGRIEIAEKDIENIEKNDRTGYVDPEQGKVDKEESLQKPMDSSPGATGDAKSGDATGTTEGAAAQDAGGGAAADGSATDLETEARADLEREIQAHCADLTRQKSNIRASAERKLDDIGAAAIPEILKLAKHPFERTRVAVFRLLKNHGDLNVGPACLEALRDDNRFVRELAWQTLKQISGRSYYFPWDDETATDEDREAAIERWLQWWDEEAAPQLEKERREAEKSGAGK